MVELWLASIIMSFVNIVFTSERNVPYHIFNQNAMKMSLMNVVNWLHTRSNLVFNILEKEGIEMDHYYSPLFQVVVSGAPISSVS